VPATLQAVVALVLALLPGALAVWAFERNAGAWGIALPDRLLRFIGVSAVFHAVAAPVTYWIWWGYVDSGRWEANGRLPFVVWLAVVLYVGLPIVVGWVVGRGARAERGWAKIVIGASPAPRAWDWLFFGRPDGWLRLRLKSGTWIGGTFTQDSYAAGYPEPSDLYLATAAEIDSDSGAFVFGADGQPLLRDSGILVRWEEVEYLEFIDG
jgi:hypothetical protein